MAVPKSWRTVEIEQKCSFGWTKENIKKFLADWAVVKDFAYILQDRCTRADGSLKDAHCHCMIRFTSPVPTSAILARGKAVFGNDTTVTIQTLEKCKKWDSAIAYLTHSNAPEKTRYNDDEVVSNFDWQPLRDMAISPIHDKRLMEIVKQIDSETVRKYNYMDYISAAEYVKYHKQIDDTFKYVNDRNISKGAVKNMKVMYLTGGSGTGKTTYAKQFADEHGLSYYVSSGSNDVLDGYGGQDVLILDDLRPSCMGLADLLKLLDNNTSSTIKSRYINKSIAYCKYIIITTTLDIDTFFRNVFKEEDETVVQLKRRCKTYMKFTAENIQVYTWNGAKRHYDFVTTIPNTVLAQFHEDAMSDDDKIGMIEDLFKGMKDVSKYFVRSESSLGDDGEQMRIEEILDEFENKKK